MSGDCTLIKLQKLWFPQRISEFALFNECMHEHFLSKAVNIIYRLQYLGDCLWSIRYQTIQRETKYFYNLSGKL